MASGGLGTMSTDRRAGPPRLLSIPARHPYVDAVRPERVREVWPARPPWASDPVFAAATVAELAGVADLVHLHFGFDHLEAAGARGWVAGLGAAGLPLVLTVHDLRNPHHSTRDRHDAVLEVLVPAAAAVVTLTAGAAAEIGRRFARSATVLPHPTVLPDPERSADVARERGLVALHLKSLRRNLQEPDGVLRAAAAGATAAGGWLRVDLHPEVADDPRLADLLTATAPAGVEVCRHPRFTDTELERYLRRAQVTVLPHRWGSHSGWLELARDLGTRVVAPDCGYYVEQWDEVVSYGNNEESGLDLDSLTRAVADALRRPALAAADRGARLAERDRVRAAHHDLYRRVLGRPADRLAGRR